MKSWVATSPFWRRNPQMASNKQLGNHFEEELCEILFHHGFWAHNLAQNQAGQPADVLAVRNKIAYLIDCKVCSTTKGFALKRMEENQDLSMTLWKECGNGDGWFAILLSDQIYMIPHFTIRAMQAQQSYLSPAEVFEIGKPLEKWIARCK